MQVINESSIRQLVASDVLNRLRADQQRAEEAVQFAQRNRSSAEEALRKFFRITWNQGASQSQQSQQESKEELDAKLAQLKFNASQASEELRLATLRLNTLNTARKQHEDEIAANAATGSSSQQQQQSARGGVYDDDRNGNLMMMRSNNGRNFMNPNIVSNQQQLDELHARAAGTSLLAHNNNNKNLIGPTVAGGSQEYHRRNNNNNNNNSFSLASSSSQNMMMMMPNNNNNNNIFGASQPLINSTIAQDYEGGELVPSATRVYAGDKGNKKTNKDANNKKANDSEFSPSKVLATTLQRQKKQSGKIRNRLERIAESDDDLDENDSDEGDMMMMRMMGNRRRNNKKNKKNNSSQKIKTELGVKKEQAADDSDSSTSTSTSSSSSSSDEDDDLDEELDDKVAQSMQPSADDLVPIRIIDNDDYYLPKYVWTSLLGYQQEAMRWFCGLHRRRVGGIEGDEMGLGKTVMLSSFIHCLKFSGKLVGPVLIVAPLTVLAQWKREIEKWCSNMQVAVLHSMDLSSTAASRKANKNKANKRKGNKKNGVKKENDDDDDDQSSIDSDDADALLRGDDADDDDADGLLLTRTSASTNLQALLRDQVRGKTNVIGLTTYNTLARNVEAFIACNFDVVALDEGHKIANPEAGLTIAAKSLPTSHRYILSGSPIQNSLIEIWSLFDFCCPGLLGGATSFVSAFEDPIKASRNPHATPLQLATAVECARALRDQITPFLLRRLKKDVNKMLPRKVEKAVLCPLSDSQLQAYVDILASSEARAVEQQHMATQQELSGLDRHGRERATGSLNLLGVNRKRSMRGLMHRCWELLADLRSICNHVDIFRVRNAHRAEKQDNAMAAANNDLLFLRAGIQNTNNSNKNNNKNNNNNANDDEINTGGADKKPKKKAATATSLSFRSNNPVDLGGSSKLAALMELLEQWQPGGHKVLVFCQTRMMLDIIENAVSQKQYCYIRMDGTTAGASRHDIVHKFNQDPGIYCALLTTRVGGLGLNLTGADRVVLFDPDWNPVVDEQARERAWRIGQQREVHVFRLICSGTIEEHILHRQMAKMFVTEKVLSDPTLQRFFSIHSLVDAFRLGSEYSERVSEACHGTIISNAISIRPSIKQEINQGMSTSQQQKNNNNNNNNSSFKIVHDEHAQSAPERVSMNSGASNSYERAGSNHPSYYNQQNKSNSQNNNMMMMTMMPSSQQQQRNQQQYQQQYQQQSLNTRTLEMDDGNNINNGNGGNNNASGDTGVLSALVDGTNDEDGVMQRANTQTSIAARRLAQLSALTTLKKALTNNGGHNNNNSNNNSQNSQSRRR